MACNSLDDAERHALLRRVDRGTATVGSRVPDSVTIDDTDVALREFVVTTRNQRTLTPAERDRVKDVRDRLGTERERRRERLATADLTVDEATALADSIVGLDRALAALADLSERSLEADRHERHVESHRAWLDFLDNIQR
ncbi:DUF5788 family protein [Halorubellus salinus]|uniref:DUF5788 family protein n=1 Tax=Halorubellus salinus TaxID=755309 RepID=UPI001D05E293|nr:DUF5788 family protein [Halorubellus salinus]